MNPDRVTSRLARRERNKLLSQTIFLFLGAVAVITIFVFAILPSFIKVINAIFGGPDAIEVTDTIPPQVPIVVSPVDATSSAELKISGYAEAKSEVTLILNGQAKEAVSAKDDGAFESTIELSEGENSLVLYAVDEAKNESQQTKSYLIVLDTEAPILEVTSPEDGQVVVGKNNQTITISGKTEPNSKVYVNNRLVFPSPEGDFSYPFRLEEGENTISIKTVDLGGNTVEQPKKVTFTP